MTDAPRPDDLRDELASAYLDGEATPEERARVEADRDLLTRVERLATVRATIQAAVAPVDEARREAAVAAALAAAEEPGGLLHETTVPTGAARVVPLASRARRADRTRSLRYLAVAAAIVVAALAVPLLSRLDRGDEADTASVALEDDSEAFESRAGDGSGDDAQDAAGMTPEATAGSDPTSLGAFADLDELAAAVREQPVLDTGPAATTTTLEGGAEAMTSTTAGACAGVLELPANAEVLLEATAVVADVPVVVVVHRTPGGAPQLLVTSAADCTTIANRAL